jgi:hypothetical protein
VIFHLNVFPDLGDFAFGVDQEGAADYAFVRAAHELFHLPHAVGFDHFVIGIAEQGKIQFLFGAKLGQQFFRVGAGAQDQHTYFVEGFFCVAKLGRFGCSTGSVGFREKEEDDTAAAEIG